MLNVIVVFFLNQHEKIHIFCRESHASSLLFVSILRKLFAKMIFSELYNIIRKALILAIQSEPYLGLITIISHFNTICTTGLSGKLINISFDLNRLYLSYKSHLLQKTIHTVFGGIG